MSGGGGNYDVPDGDNCTHVDYNYNSLGCGSFLLVEIEVVRRNRV